MPSVCWLLCPPVSLGAALFVRFVTSSWLQSIKQRTWRSVHIDRAEFLFSRLEWFDVSFLQHWMSTVLLLDEIRAFSCSGHFHYDHYSRWLKRFLKWIHNDEMLIKHINFHPCWFFSFHLKVMTVLVTEVWLFWCGVVNSGCTLYLSTGIWKLKRDESVRCPWSLWYLAC